MRTSGEFLNGSNVKDRKIRGFKTGTESKESDGYSKPKATVEKPLVLPGKEDPQSEVHDSVKDAGSSKEVIVSGQRQRVKRDTHYQTLMNYSKVNPNSVDLWKLSLLKK